MRRKLATIERRAARRAYFGAAHLARVDEMRLRRCGRTGQAVVLLLHRVATESNPFWPAIDPDLFRDLVAWLSKRARIVLLRDLREVPDDERPPVVLSFDDGYKDFVTFAHPILEDFGVRANLNIIAMSILTGKPPASVQFTDLLDSAPLPHLMPLQLGSAALSLRSDDPIDKERFGAAAGARFKSLEPAEQQRVLTNLRSRWGDSGRRTEMMDRGDVVAMAEAGHEIGLHSFGHDSIAALPDEALVADLERCQQLAHELELEPSVYAFPDGRYRPHQIEVLRQRGFEHLLVVDRVPAHRTAHLHPRLPVRGGSLAELACRSAGLSGPLRATLAGAS